MSRLHSSSPVLHQSRTETGQLLIGAGKKNNAAVMSIPILRADGYDQDGKTLEILSMDVLAVSDNNKNNSKFHRLFLFNLIAVDILNLIYPVSRLNKARPK